MSSERNVADILAHEAEATEQGRDVDADYVPSNRPPKDPAQVYSVRLPVDRLEELRQFATRQGVAPSALLRRWVIERLDRELDHASRVAEVREAHGAHGDDVLVVTKDQLDSLMYNYLQEHADLITRLAREGARRESSG
jgi:hypothetical protein